MLKILLFFTFLTIIFTQRYHATYYEGSTTCESRNSRDRTGNAYCRGGEIGYYGVTCNKTHVIVHDICPDSNCHVHQCKSRYYEIGKCIKWTERDSQKWTKCD